MHADCGHRQLLRLPRWPVPCWLVLDCDEVASLASASLDKKKLIGAFRELEAHLGREPSLRATAPSTLARGTRARRT